MIKISVGRLVKVVLFLTFITLLYYYLGYLVSTGYSVEMRFYVSARPSKLCICNFSSPSKYPLMIIVGYAYTKVRVNESMNSNFSYIPFTEGNVTCRLIPKNKVYVCKGNGYLYKYVGKVMEVVHDNELTRYYYVGPALGVRGTVIILYSYGLAEAVIYTLVPASSILAMYLSMRLSSRHGCRLFSLLISLVATVIMGIAFYEGALRGLSEIPEDLNALKVVMTSESLKALYILVATTIVSTLALCTLRKYLRSEKTP